MALLQLPVEIILKICGNLPLAQLVPLTSTCKAVCRIVASHNLFTADHHVFSRMNRNTMTEASRDIEKRAAHGAQYLTGLRCCTTDVEFDNQSYYKHLQYCHTSPIYYGSSGRARSYVKGLLVMVAYGQMMAKYIRALPEEFREWVESGHLYHKVLVRHFLKQYLDKADQDLRALRRHLFP